MKIEDMIEVMDHYRRGGRVEREYSVTAEYSDWEDINNYSHNWNFTWDYRIHPQEQAIIDSFISDEHSVEKQSHKISGWSWERAYYKQWHWGGYSYRIKPKEDNLKECEYIYPVKGNTLRGTYGDNAWRGYLNKSDREKISSVFEKPSKEDECKFREKIEVPKRWNKEQRGYCSDEELEEYDNTIIDCLNKIVERLDEKE